MISVSFLVNGQIVLPFRFFLHSAEPLYFHLRHFRTELEECFGCQQVPAKYTIIVFWVPYNSSIFRVILSCSDFRSAAIVSPFMCHVSLPTSWGIIMSELFNNHKLCSEQRSTGQYFFFHACNFQSRCPCPHRRSMAVLKMLPEVVCPEELLCLITRSKPVDFL